MRPPYYNLNCIIIIFHICRIFSFIRNFILLYYIINCFSSCHEGILGTGWLHLLTHPPHQVELSGKLQAAAVLPREGKHPTYRLNSKLVSSMVVPDGFDKGQISYSCREQNRFSFLACNKVKLRSQYFCTCVRRQFACSVDCERCEPGIAADMTSN